MEPKPSDVRVTPSLDSSVRAKEKPSRAFPQPSTTPLLRRYLIYGRTTLALLCVSGAIGTGAAWFLKTTLTKKLAGLYSKSTPHRLERQKHLFVNNAANDVNADGPSINEVDEDEDEVEDEEHSSEPKTGEDPVARFKDGALKLLERTKQEVARGFDRVQKTATLDPMDKFAFFKRDDPDMLRKIALSRNHMAWKFGIEALATMVRGVLSFEHCVFRRACVCVFVCVRLPFCVCLCVCVLIALFLLIPQMNQLFASNNHAYCSLHSVSPRLA